MPKPDFKWWAHTAVWVRDDQTQVEFVTSKIEAGNPTAAMEKVEQDITNRLDGAAHTITECTLARMKGD
jgi:hypothetical protein